jgi:[acyl-carrier-protein] S-malonyltransferase
MQEAVPAGEGAMAAILGLEAGPLEEACAEAASAGGVVSPANFNAPGQIVIAGHRAAVERAIAAAQARGAKRAMMLPVSAPFHCALMAPAAARLRGDLAALELSTFRVPLVANVTADVVADPEVERELLALQVTAPVRWQQSVERLMALGVDSLVEVGPGKVLAGLARRIARDLRTFSVGSPAEADEAARALA